MRFETHPVVGDGKYESNPMHILALASILVALSVAGLVRGFHRRLDRMWETGK